MNYMREYVNKLPVSKMLSLLATTRVQTET